MSVHCELGEQVDSVRKGEALCFHKESTFSAFIKQKGVKEKCAGEQGVFLRASGHPQYLS